MNFLKRHYEKILLASLLTVFIFLLVYQLAFWSQNEQLQVKELRNFQEPVPNYKKIDFDKTDSSFNLKKNLDKQIKWEKAVSRDKRTGKDFTSLLVPFPMSFCPYCMRVIPASVYPPPESLDSRKCPFCSKTLHAPLEKTRAANRDTDGDGIPDEKELALGLDPNDPLDGKVDKDADGFSNAEEFFSKTDMNNPKSRPAFYEKFSVASISRAVLPFRLKSVMENKGEYKIGITIKRRGKKDLQQFFAVNQEFKTLAGPFRILQVIPKKNDAGMVSVDHSSVVVLNVKTNEKITIQKNQPVYEPHEKLILDWNRVRDHKEFELLKGSKFTASLPKTDADEYQVISMNLSKMEAVIKDLKKEDKIYTIGEKSILTQKMNAVRKKSGRTRRIKKENNNE